MRASYGRVAAALTFLLAGGYLLQANDSPSPATQIQPPAFQPAQITSTDVAADHDYYVSHREIVPLGRRTIDLPILMYHYIRTPPSIFRDRLGYNLSVSPRDFQIQMDWLAAHGYHTVDFNDVRAYFAGSRPLPSKPVIITLDDGYKDLYTTAFPILAAHGFKAVAYIVSGFVGWSRYVTADQIVQMDLYGIQIAAHTVHHADLARASQGAVMYEIVASKRFLENLVGHPIVDFAYPSGKFNFPAINALSQAGYDTAVTELVSTSHSRADRYVWARIRVAGGESLADFIHYLGPVMPSVTLTAVNVETAAEPSMSGMPIAIRPI